MITICKKLNALNSDAYRYVSPFVSIPHFYFLFYPINSRCMYALAFHPETSYQDIRNLHTELDEARKLPFFAVNSIRIPFRAVNSLDESDEIPIEPPISHKNLLVCAECKSLNFLSLI